MVVEYNGKKFLICKSTYVADDSLALLLFTEDGEYERTLTVCLPSGIMGDAGNLAYLDTNNFPDAEKFVKKAKIGSFTGIYGYSGYCQYPLYKFDPKALELIEEAH